mmetsp:Transcript_86605/g.279623  ORF Transcript_86605/g.279623 Transcript_86605/m.279623 type:complete len:209 (+) Transcript_86605:1041-1667(+)
MPLDRPLAMFPKPCPMHSFDVLPRLPSSSNPSTNWSVSKDSTNPTAAIVAAYGKRMPRVCRGAVSQGTAGSPSGGSTLKPPLNVSAPAMSINVRAGKPKSFTAEVTMPTVRSDEGTAVVNLGSTLTSAMEIAVRPHIVSPWAPPSKAPETGSRKCVNCALKMTMASPLTKPNITGCGTNLMNLPQPRQPTVICRRPASRTAPLKYEGP